MKRKSTFWLPLKVLFLYALFTFFTFGAASHMHSHHMDVICLPSRFRSV